MKAQKIFIDLLLFIFILNLSSCIKYFEISPEIHERKVTVNGLLIAGENPIITVKKNYLPTDTVKIILDNSSDSNMIKNAIVILSTEDNKKDTLKYSDSIYYNGFILKGYTTDTTLDSTKIIIPQEGHSYLLKVEVSGYGILTSTTTVPYSPKIDTVIRHPDTSQFYAGRTIDIVINDSCYTPEYYFITGYGDFSTEDPNCISFYQNLLLSDKSFNCSNYTLTLTVDEHLPYILFYKANIDLGVYVETLYFQVSQRRFRDFPNPFQEPSVVYSNIKNGTGIFAAVSKPVIINLNSK